MRKNIKSEVILALSFCSIFILTTLLSFLVTHIQIIKTFDKYFYNLISSIHRNIILDTLVFPINKNFLSIGPSNFPIYLVFIGIISWIYIYFKKKNILREFTLVLAVGATFAALQYVFNSEFIFRSRPFLENKPLYLDELTKQQLKLWTSFPSGHTRETTLLLTIISHYIPKFKLPAILICIFVAFSRVYLGVHYPTDVIAGLLIGFLSALVSIHSVKVVKKVFKLKLY